MDNIAYPIAKRLAGTLIALCCVAGLFASTTEAATTIYLRPNGDTTTGWTTTGAANAWEALDDNVTEQEAPSNTDYISGHLPILQPAPITELAMTSTSLSGQTILSATAWFYTPSAGSVAASVKSGSTVLSNQTFTTAGWHVMTLALDGTQAQLDNATLVLSTESTETQYVYAAFLRVVMQPESAGTPAYLRPNGDSTTAWTTTGATKPWEALDDNVNERDTPLKTDYISGRQRLLQPMPVTELALTSTSLSGQTILSATAWFYTPSAGSVAASVKSGPTVLASQTFTTAGWHVLPLTLDGTQSQLDNATLLLSTKSTETQYVYAAFLRLVLGPKPTQIYWGAWMSGEAFTPPTGTAPWDEETWSNFEKDAGKAVSIVHFGQPPPWREPFNPTLFSWIRAGGSIPFMDMSSEPDIINGEEHINVTLQDIVNGNPEVIGPFEEWASDVATEYEYPFFFRWDWEMNGSWSQWGEEAKENPELFVKAWHRLYDIAQNAGATNITWVWCPNTSFEGSTSLKALYPGDTYVDWLCMDGYNRGTNPIHSEEWTTFHERFSQTYQELLSLAPWKPIMIGETASTESGGSKAEWISQALETEIPNNFPNVRALVWFNWYIEDEEAKKRWDWPIESSTSAKAAFASAIASSYYASDSFGSLAELERIQPLP